MPERPARSPGGAPWKLVEENLKKLGGDSAFPLLRRLRELTWEGRFSRRDVVEAWAEKYPHEARDYGLFAAERDVLAPQRVNELMKMARPQIDETLIMEFFEWWVRKADPTATQKIKTRNELRNLHQKVMKDYRSNLGVDARRGGRAQASASARRAHVPSRARSTGQRLVRADEAATDNPLSWRFTVIGSDNPAAWGFSTDFDMPGQMSATGRLAVLGQDDPRDNLDERALAQPVDVVRARLAEYDRRLQRSTDTAALDPRSLFVIRHNTAYLMLQLTKVTEARDLFEKLLIDREGALEDGDGDILATRHSLANCRGAAGELDRAVTDLTDVITARERELGPNHPDTLISRCARARWRGGSEDFRRAVSELNDVLDIRRTYLLQDFSTPASLRIRHHMAFWRGHTDATAKAVESLQKVIDEQTSVLDADHPDTLETRFSLAVLLERMDRRDTVPMLKNLHADQTRLLGAEHSITSTTRQHLRLYDETAS